MENNQKDQENQGVFAEQINARTTEKRRIPAFQGLIVEQVQPAYGINQTPPVINKKDMITGRILPRANNEIPSVLSAFGFICLFSPIR